MKNLLLIGLIFCSSVSFAADLTPAEILKKADAVKNPLESFRMKISVSGTDQNDETILELSTANNEKAYAAWLAPARDRGRKFLMLGEELWVYLPNLKRAVRSSLNQKLTGLAANGDICRMQWSQDYDAKIEKTEDTAWVLFLQAKKKGLTYDKIRVWIQKSDFHPLKAEYLTVSGKVLKTAVYKDYRDIAGANRPTSIVIQDVIRADSISTIRILEMEAKRFPESLFQRSSL